MPPRPRWIAALIAFLVVWVSLAAPVMAQRDLNNLPPPWPQPAPGNPWMEFEATVGVSNWKSFFSDLRELAATKGFFAYPYSNDPEVKHFVGMMLYRDDLFVNLYNADEAPDVFIVGLFRTNIYDEAEIGARAFLPLLEEAVGRVSGGRVGENRVDPALGAKSQLRPPMRIAEFSVPPEAVRDVFRLLSRLTSRGQFDGTLSYMDRRVPLRRVDMWRTNLKVAAVNQLAPEKFRVTIFSYLPVVNYPPQGLEDFADTFIKELTEGVAQIPGSHFTVVKR